MEMSSPYQISEAAASSVIDSADVQGFIPVLHIVADLR